jgi:YD repeat-containing protein
VAQHAVGQLQASADVTRYLGTPVTVHGSVTGQVREDETGWQEARLTVPVRGSRAEGVVKLVGGRHTGEWKFTTFEVAIPSAHKRVDLVAGRIVDYDPDAYVEIHTEAVRTPEGVRTTVPPARWNGDFPCVSTVAAPGSRPRIASCATPGPVAALKTGSVDRFDVDLRFGKFILRQTDLLVKDGALEVPLTRTYASQFWIHRSRVHAFGRNSTHDFDVAPIGARNPYTHLMMILPDGDFLFLRRVSAGGGYADAVYQHSETSSMFYKALIRWDGNGWDTRLADGATIHYPESYSSKNLAQGAATQMVDASGNVLRLVRDPQRNLREIRTPSDRWIKFAYDEQARVVRADTDAGDWVEYRYGTDELLTAVKFSDGRARHYAYAGDMLTWVRDETGRVLIHNWYRDGRIVRQDYSNGQSYQISYTLGWNNMYVDEATVTLPDGSVRSVHTGESVAEYLRDFRWDRADVSWWGAILHALKWW